MKLGDIKNHGFDAESHERLERLEAVVECDTCGKEVELWSDSVAWEQRWDGKWRHTEYGPAQGVCCQNLYVSSFDDGCYRYKLEHSF